MKTVFITAAVLIAVGATGTYYLDGIGQMAQAGIMAGYSQ